jgi:hypothetical protein
MTRLLASEVAKLRTTRALFIYVALLAVVTVLIVVATFLTLSNSEFTQQDLRDLMSAASIAGIFVILLGILVFTAEFRHGTAPETFLVTPRRERVLVAKTLLGLLLGALLSLFALGLIAALALPWMEARDMSLDLWNDELTTLYIGVVGSGALWGALGVGIGGAVRNQVAAVVGTLVWFLLLENILFGFLPDYGKYAPGIASNALVDPSIEDDLGRNAAWLVTLAWTAGLVLVAGVLLRARDVD